MDEQRGVPDSPGPAEASHSSSSSTSALEELDNEDVHHTGHADQPQQQQYFPATPDSRHGPPLMHRPHCPPPAHPAPSHPPAAALPWSLDPSTAATSGDTVTGLSKDCPPSSPPRQRPLSLPSRLCPTDSGDPIWDSLFPSGATAAGPGGRDSGEGIAWRPAATWHAERSVEEGGLTVESLQGRRGSAVRLVALRRCVQYLLNVFTPIGIFKGFCGDLNAQRRVALASPLRQKAMDTLCLYMLIFIMPSHVVRGTAVPSLPICTQDTSSKPAAAAAASLSSWLSYLNLRCFETALVGVGVEAMGDLR